MKDSLGAEGPTKERMTISINETSMSHATDMDPKIPGGGHDGYFRFLYGVDSMQDSLRISEIDSAFRLAIVKENVRVPFSIIKMDSACPHPENSDNMVTIGFAKPVTYQLRLGNTAFYLFKRIGLPVIFSCLLLCITVLAFVMLYRNMIRQRRLGELKNEFISNITHELKTPITTAGVAIEALKNFNAIQDPQRTKEYLDISSHELQRLSLLADKVLKLSMFEKTEVEMVPEEINLEGIIGEVLTSLKIQFEKYHATITLSSQGNMNMKGDRLHLQSVIFNLLDNALKYGKEGPVIKIELREKENTILLQVSDNGIGIAPEYKEKVFEKFFRVPHGDTHNTKGYGLGLSYAAQVIQKHGGTITVDSQPGKPTRFIIELPKKPA
jgi:two-component system phosphate regulon sensor histidine kinase PhoR